MNEVIRIAKGNRRSFTALRSVQDDSAWGEWESHKVADYNLLDGIKVECYIG
jgi:hypothetical protein